MNEAVYTLQEIAEMLKISKATARRLFAHESGILALNSLGKKSTANGRVLIRVPESVYQRVVSGMRRI